MKPAVKMKSKYTTAYVLDKALMLALANKGLSLTHATHEVLGALKLINTTLATQPLVDGHERGVRA